MHIKTTLKKIRGYLLVTKKEMAERLLISQASYYLYEEKGRLPKDKTLDKVYQLAKECNIEVVIER